ncbi:MAG: CHAD domain-containing protein, partial [Chlorobiaceae bacterium]|nr:CHAD domain-containing protein [Chlorobiaceae bacterium]
FFKAPDTTLPMRWNGGEFSPDFRIAGTSARKEQRSFYDTFDWHAFEKKLSIVKKKNTLLLYSLDSGLETARVELKGSPASFFASRLPAGQAKDLLTACSGIRAFSRIACFDILLRTSRIIDDNGKTVGFLLTESFGICGENPQMPFLSLTSVLPLKGYQDETDRFSKMLASRFSLDDAFDFRELFRMLMAEAGRTVQGYSSKINIELNPDAPVHESARKLLFSTLSVMKANEEGVKKNIDPEFLHDFRVAIRRTRSLLRQLKGVFSPEETERFLCGFTELGKRSNSLRDCDVYLHHKGTYFNSLPDFLQPPLTRFFTELESSRKKHHRQFCRYLDSETYRNFFDDWTGFLANPHLPDPEKAPEAALPTFNIASSGIRKAWKKVVRRGRLACGETTDDELHELRIDCKKLRYLLEFFSSVYPHETIAPVVRQLKELQENLGTFVDYSVQVRFLQERLNSLNTAPGNHLFAAATGGLITVLCMKKEETRADFHKAFRTFDQEETRQRFTELLGKKE